MPTHPLHELFRTVDTQKDADSTTLQCLLCCNYCQRTWELHQYPSGERQGKWRVVEFSQLRFHMLNECDYCGNDDIHSVASATSKREAFARVEEIRRVHNRPWPPLPSPPATSAHDQLTVTATAASQSLAPQGPRTASTLQQDQLPGLLAGNTFMSPSERHCMTSGAMTDDGLFTLPRHNCRWVYILNKRLLKKKMGVYPERQWPARRRLECC
jgi:hypothetical protein